MTGKNIFRTNEIRKPANSENVENLEGLISV